MAKKKVFQISDALTEGLEETITAAHRYSGELRVEAIPIKKIEMDPDNPRDFVLSFDDLYHGIAKSDKDYLRKMKEKESLKTIAFSIKEQGIINPVIVYKQGEKYRLIAGERRTLASILADKTDIQAKILDSKPAELKISLLQWIENVERRDLSLGERLKNLEQIISAYAMQKNKPAAEVTATEISQLLGCTLPHAMNYKTALLADEKIKVLIKENKIRNLEKIALICQIQSINIKQQAIDACLKGATQKELKRIADQDKAKNKLSLNLSSPVKKKGRQAIKVNFGVTKNTHVAKIIINSVLRNDSLTHIQPHFAELNWNDYQAVTEAFKKLLKTLEQIPLESVQM